MVDVENVIKVIIADHLGIDLQDIKDSDDFISLGADSLGVIDIVFKIEDALNIDIPLNTSGEDSVKIDTVGDAVHSVRKIVEIGE